MITKEQVEEILRISEEENIPEKDAALKVVGKRICMNGYKHKYGFPLYATGKSPHSHSKRWKSVNDEYFQNYTLENCYYAGFIAADGNIDSTQTKLTIGLSAKDKEWLETFTQKCKSDATVREFTIKDKYSGSSITITSKPMCESLRDNFNITPHKSLTLLPPPLSDNTLKDAFIVGLIDGDGSIGFASNKNKRDRFYISFLGTEEVVSFVKKRFEEILGSSVSNLHNRKKGVNSYSIAISDAKARKIFLYYYFINVPKLERKWSKEKYDYCLNFKKALPIVKRKGVNIFNLQGEFIKHFDTLKEASNFTNVTVGRISTLCKLDDSKHMANGYMCSRTKERMEKYQPTNAFAKTLMANKFASLK